VDIVDIFAIESTTVRPTFEIYPAGNRVYKLINWDEVGVDAT
jgi:hypothetical protein